jgi:predicted dienelactone hydrolase
VVVIIAVVIASASGGGPSRSSRAASAGSSSGRGSTTSPRRAQHKPPVHKPSAYRVGITNLTVSEPATAAVTTATTSTSTTSTTAARSLATRVRYPAIGAPIGPPQPGGSPDLGHGPFPLIIFSQGFNYPAEGYAALMNAWARAGYVVADPTYPLTDPTDAAGVNETDILHHPADLRSVISRLLAAGRAASGPLHGLINPSEVALVGQSDGGDVSLAVAANTCCRDPRVRAAAILSGAELPAFGGRYYAAGSPPLLVVQGDQDTINAAGCSAALYNGAPAPKYYVDLLGASHLTPYVGPGPWQVRVQRAVTAFLDLYLKHESGGLRRLQRAAQAPGVVTLTTAPALAGQSTYCPPTGIP